MKPYWIDDIWTGKIHFYGERKTLTARVRKPRERATKLYCRQGGIPYLPFRIAKYRTPTFYYTELMNHRRKRGLDYGPEKVHYGMWRALSSKAEDFE